MGWRGTVALLVLVVAAGLYVLLGEAPPPPPPPETTLLGEPRWVDPDKLVPLLDFDPADVTAVRLRSNGLTRVAKRRDASWEGHAAGKALDDFLTNLAGLARVLEVAVRTEELADYGLQPPQQVIELQLRSRPEPLTLEIGDANPATTGVYTRVNGAGPVILAGALVSWEFDKAFRAIAAPTRAPGH